MGCPRDCSWYGRTCCLVVKHRNIYWSYSDYYQRIADFYTGLLAIGIKLGDRVAIWATNSMEWCVGQFATAIMVCINPVDGLHKLSYALKKVGCKALITAKTFKSSNYLEMLKKLLPEIENKQPVIFSRNNLPLFIN